ncbi:hypothetical protein HY626_02810 [Candidatus Uhrbacteria bacterium]|nr:hypothetical protein [Candidatus Uhrbacteria bacterium]
MIFSSGLGIDVTDSYVRLARVSFFGRVIETKEWKLPDGLVVDDLVVAPKGFQAFIITSYIDEHKRFRRLPTAMTIPESRVFDASTQEGVPLNISLQKQIPFPLSEMMVAKEVGSSRVQVVEKSAYESFVSAIDSGHMNLRFVVSRIVAFEQFVLYFKQKETNNQFEAAIGAAFLAAHPWRFRHLFHFFTYESKRN